MGDTRRARSRHGGLSVRAETPPRGVNSSRSRRRRSPTARVVVTGSGGASATGGPISTTAFANREIPVFSPGMCASLPKTRRRARHSEARRRDARRRTRLVDRSATCRGSWTRRRARRTRPRRRCRSWTKTEGRLSWRPRKNSSLRATSPLLPPRRRSSSRDGRRSRALTLNCDATESIRSRSAMPRRPNPRLCRRLPRRRHRDALTTHLSSTSRLVETRFRAPRRPEPRRPEPRSRGRSRGRR